MSKVKKFVGRNRKVAIAVCAAAFLLTAGGLLSLTACGKLADGPEYEYSYDKPFAPEADTFMTVDGKLDEPQWQGQNRMVHTSDGITITATTVFTEKGLYVGVEALDTNVQWYSRSNFEDNSNFHIRIAGDGEPNYDIGNPSMQHPMRYYDFNIDAQTARSYLETPYIAKAYVVGEVNSAETTSISAELFVAWEDMLLTGDDFGEQGYPDSMGVFVSYRKVEGEENPDNIDLIPSFNEDYRYQTYFRYGPEGLKNVYTSAEMGNANGGPAASDRWTIDDETRTAVSVENRTQVLWFKDGYAQNFMLEATIEQGELPDGPLGYPTPGLISYGNADAYKLFGFDGAALANSGVLHLASGDRTDGMQILDKRTQDEDVQTGYADTKVTLRLIKWGTKYYYFYNDEYWLSEEMVDHTGGAYAGLFSNGKATFTDYSFTNFDGREEDLRAELAKYMYLVTVPGVMARGSIVADKLAVKHGDSLTLTFRSGSAGYVLTELYDGGNDIYDVVTREMKDSVYTFTPDADVDITAVYSEFPREARVSVLLPLVNEETGEPVFDASYVITCDSNQVLRYNGTANSRGNIVITLPKAGEYSVGGDVKRNVSVSGNYTVTVEAGGYHDFETSFTLDDDTTSTSIEGEPESVKEDGVYTQSLVFRPHAYGPVTVNGTLVPSYGVLEYDDTTGLYYVANPDRVGQYYRHMTGTEFVVEAKLTFSGMDNTGSDPVAGIALSSGNKTIILKSCRWETNRLCIAAGDNIDATVETSVTGFAHTIGESDGELVVTVVRYGDTVYLYDCDNVLKVYLDEDGIHTLNGASFAYEVPSDLTNRVSDFFDDGEENAVGVVKYGGNYAKVVWDIGFETEGVRERIYGGDFTFECETEKYIAEVNGLAVGNGFIRDSLVTITIEAKDSSEFARQIVLVGENGEPQTVDGIYSFEENASVFSFTYDQAYIVSEIVYGKFAVVSVEVTGTTAESGTLTFIGGGAEYPFEIDPTGDKAEIAYGTYDIVYTDGNFTALREDVEISSDISLTFAAAENKNTMLGASVEVNGRTLTAAYGGNSTDVSLTDMAHSALGAFTLEGDTRNAYFMPGTSTEKDYVYSVNIKNVGNMAGIFVTDGVNIFGLQIQQTIGYKHLILTCGALTGWGEPWTIATFASGDKNDGNTTLKLVRAGSSLEVYIDTYDGENGASSEVYVGRILSDGTFEKGAGISLAESAQGGIAAAKTSLAALLAADGHAAGLWRNNGSAQSVTYTPAFTEVETFILTGTVVFEGMPGAVAALEFESAESGSVYTAEGVNGTFSIELPYGEYVYTASAAGCYDVVGSFTFSEGQTDMGEITLAAIPVYSVVVIVSGTDVAEGRIVFIDRKSGAEYAFDVAPRGGEIGLYGGEYEVFYTDDGHAAYAESVTLNADGDLQLAASENRNTMLGGSATVNGITADKGIGGKEITVGLSVRTYSALNGSFTLEGDTQQTYFMPGTVTDKDYIYTLNLANVGNMAGLFVTDGTNIFGLQINNNWNAQYKHVILTGGPLTGWGEPNTQMSIAPGNQNFADTTLILIRRGNIFEAYIDTADGEGTILICTVVADGTIFLGEGVKAEGNTADGGITAAKDSLAALLAADEHVAGLWRNNGSVQSVTYTPVFDEVAFGTVLVSATAENGMEVTAEFVSATTGIRYTATGVDGEIRVELPYGEYTYTLSSPGSRSVTGTIALSSAEAEIPAVVLVSANYTVTVTVEGTVSQTGELTVVGNDAEYTFDIQTAGQEIDLPEGMYDVFYSDGTFVAEQRGVEVTRDMALALIATRNTMLSNEATVNGQTYTQFFGDGLWGSEVNGAPVDAALQAESGENASFTIENDRRNSYVMPGTVTDKDYEYSVNVTDPNSTFCSFAGLFVSDGTNVLALQVQNNGGLAISGGKRTDWGEPWTFVNLPEGKAIDLRNFSLKIARNGNTIEMYIDFDGTGSSGGYEKIGTVNADGSITFAEGFTAANSNTGNGVLDVLSQEAFAALLAADEHVAGLWRNSVDVQSVTYTPVFTAKERD